MPLRIGYPLADMSATLSGHGRAPHRASAAGLLMLVSLLAGCAPTASRSTAPLAPTPLSASVAATPIAQPHTIAHATLFVEPDDRVGAVTRGIRAAQHSILLVMYLFTDSTLLTDIERAAARGVTIHVLLEQQPYGSFGGTSPNQRAYDRLMAANIPVEWANPAFSLTHEKAMVIDSRTTYIMTTNFTYSAFRRNREFGIVTTATSVVATITHLFWADWRRQAIVPTDTEVPVSPTDSRMLLAAFITSARQTLDIYAEELQDGMMAGLLARAAQRGVHVRLILPAPAQGSPNHNATLASEVASSGVQVRDMPDTLLYIHAKAIVADGRRVFIGSENLSAASLDDNREVGIFVADPAITLRLTHIFATDWQRASP